MMSANTEVMPRVARLTFAVAVAAALLTPATAQANEISYFTTVYDTDYVTSSLGLRDVGAGNLSLAGVGGTVTKAYLYWQGPTNSSDSAVNANVSFDGTNIVGTNIGFSDDNFWNFENGQAYRADVTSLVAGNGDYALGNFQKLPTAAINGVSLFVFFDDGDDTNNRDVVLFNGNDSNFASDFDQPGWDLTLNGIDYSAGNANLVTYVSDGQNFGANDDGTLRVNGTSVGTGGLFQGASPRAPGAGVANGSLTDIRTFDVTSLLSPGINNLNVTLDAGFSDALSLVVAAIDLPAGSAPPPPPVPEPTSLVLLGLGVAGVSRRLLRRR